jgi:hypothetical protein
MAYRRRTVVLRRGKGRRVVRYRGVGPKHGHKRHSGGIFGSLFNLHWLFGRNRHRRSV